MLKAELKIENVSMWSFLEVLGRKLLLTSKMMNQSKPDIAH